MIILTSNLDRVWDEIVRFNDRHFPNWRLTDWRILSNAIAGETGEICDATKHFNGDGTNPLLVNRVDKDDIAEEVFDVMVYSVLLLGAMGYDRDDFLKIAQKKLRKLYQRMSPEVSK